MRSIERAARAAGRRQRKGGFRGKSATVVGCAHEAVGKQVQAAPAGASHDDDVAGAVVRGRRGTAIIKSSSSSCMPAYFVLLNIDVLPGKERRSGVPDFRVPGFPS
ncbi:hypothetical protein ABZP36_036242 [Zizania latifolia]